MLEPPDLTGAACSGLLSAPIIRVSGAGEQQSEFEQAACVSPTAQAGELLA